VWDHEKVYRTMHDWLVARGYRMMESLYKDKPPETEIEWIAKKKVDEYVAYQFKVYFFIWDLEDAEVAKGGEKRVMQKGRMKITLSAAVITDYSGRWETTPFWKWLEGVYNKYIALRDLEVKHMDNLYYVLYKLHELIKQTLEMETAGGVY